jgi:acyl-CoA synthetase (AMP-forming)/AMP-acid ligase II
MEIESLLSGDAELPMLEYGGAVYLRGQIADFADEICALLDAAQVPHDAAIGVVARNRPLHQAAILGLIARGRIASMIYAFQSPKLVATDLAANRFAAVIADEMDWSAEAVEAARTCGTLGIALNSVTEAVAPLPALEPAARQRDRSGNPVQRHHRTAKADCRQQGDHGPRARNDHRIGHGHPR